MVDPEVLIDIATNPKEMCPAPAVYTVHPEKVTVAEENPYVMEDIVKSQTCIFADRRNRGLNQEARISTPMRTNQLGVAALPT